MWVMSCNGKTEVSVTSKILARLTRKVQLPFTEMGKPEGEPGLGGEQAMYLLCDSR